MYFYKRGDLGELRCVLEQNCIFWRKSKPCLQGDRNYREKPIGFMPDQVSFAEGTCASTYNDSPDRPILIGDEFVTLITYGNTSTDEKSTRDEVSAKHLSARSVVIMKGSVLTVISIDNFKDVVFLRLSLSAKLQLRYNAHLADSSVGVVGDDGELIRNPAIPGSIICFMKDALRREMRQTDYGRL
ncbi:MAG: hypothetical protein KC582_02030 [Candidatus Magasanikbacteria bacterium]|nr:hypothetical protein [Candidatus Magasanikbacteria bacterium]MCA9388977.1 hypothetical protein [Candidatus Magasanikbacteria bacterium]MCA9391008.1 hypothetical protein [Candidatus Magasanikbacteria bacterium]USN52034.1 MAG: hypothetical protein H6759_03305 [Candidatus Nomurabacteria bacterium]